MKKKLQTWLWLYHSYTLRLQITRGRQSENEGENEHVNTDSQSGKAAGGSLVLVTPNMERHYTKNWKIQVLMGGEGSESMLCK